MRRLYDVLFILVKNMQQIFRSFCCLTVTFSALTCTTQILPFIRNSELTDSDKPEDRTSELWNRHHFSSYALLLVGEKASGCSSPIDVDVVVVKIAVVRSIYELHSL